MKTFVLALVFIITGVQAQNGDFQKAAEYSRLAVQAYREKDYSLSLSNWQQALALRPDHPTLIYNLAGVHTLLGHSVEAVELLERVAQMGLVYSPQNDSDFIQLWENSTFGGIVTAFAKNAMPSNRSTVALQLNEKGLIAEGIAYDPRTGTFYVSSVRKRKVLQISSNGVEKHLSRPEDGLWSAMGMKIDDKRGVLWVSSSALPQMNGYEKAEDGRAGLFEYDLANGKLLRKYVLGDTAHPHILGDVTLTAAGEPYTTDSRSPAIYRLRANSNRLELFVDSESFVNLQGITVSSDETALFVSDYSRGIFRIDLTTKEVLHLQPPRNLTLLGIDGLSWYEGSLIAIQNGIHPHRVIRIRLNKSGDRIETWETLEANHALFDEPTLGVAEGDSFYYMANSQWSKVDRAGVLAPESRLGYHVILKIKL